MLQEEQGAVVDARQAGAEAAAEAEGVALALDVALLLLPLHAEGRVGEHVVEGPLLAVGVAVEAVLGEGVAEDDVVGVLALDQHVGLADRPGFVVPVLAVEMRVGVGVELADVLLGDGQHAAGAAGRVIDRLHDVAVGEVFFRREQQVDHQLDHLTRREVVPGLLVRLLSADPDQLLEDVAHLHVVHAIRGEVDGGERLDDLVEQVLLGHARDLRVEGEPLHDLADVGREAVDVAVEVGRELVRVVRASRCLRADRASRGCRTGRP